MPESGGPRQSGGQGGEALVPSTVAPVQFIAPTSESDCDVPEAVAAPPPLSRSKSLGEARAAVGAATNRTGSPKGAEPRTARQSKPTTAQRNAAPKLSSSSSDSRRKASECVVADPAELFEALGVTLQDPLLNLALTHRSWANEHGEVPTNERLEFLGDSVLGLVITEQLYLSYPDKEEGELAKLRANIVSTVSLAAVARRLGDGGLGRYLYLGNGEIRTGGVDKDSILADGLEALFGAVHLQYGIEKAREVVLQLCAPLLVRAVQLGAGLDWKTSLQELCARRGLRPPVYEVDEAGPDHEKLFTAMAVIDERSLGTGTGRTKKEAEMKAAGHAWGVISGEDVALPEAGV